MMILLLLLLSILVLIYIIDTYHRYNTCIPHDTFSIIRLNNNTAIPIYNKYGLTPYPINMIYPKYNGNPYINPYINP